MTTAAASTEWQVVVAETGHGEQTAVIPVDDMRPHLAGSTDCWCEPWFDDDVLVHNAGDGRETGRRVS